MFDIYARVTNHHFSKLLLCTSEGGPKNVQDSPLTFRTEFQSVTLAKNFTLSAICFLYFTISVSFPCMGLHFQ